MGRLPGGIVDETRDYIIKEVDGLHRSKLLKFAKTTQSNSEIQGAVFPLVYLSLDFLDFHKCTPIVGYALHLT